MDQQKNNSARYFSQGGPAGSSTPLRYIIFILGRLASKISAHRESIDEERSVGLEFLTVQENSCKKTIAP